MLIGLITPPAPPYTNHPPIMDSPQYSSGHTSNDLLFSLDPKRSRISPNYEIVAQSAEEVQDIDNAPAVSMGPYLLESGQTQLLATISIYSRRGESREQVRLLYMNAAALGIWKGMGKRPKLIGAQHRPPQTILRSFRLSRWFEPYPHVINSIMQEQEAYPN
jgi:hypothetical protein